MHQINKVASGLANHFLLLLARLTGPSNRGSIGDADFQRFQNLGPKDLELAEVPCAPVICWGSTRILNCFEKALYTPQQRRAGNPFHLTMSA